MKNGLLIYEPNRGGIFNIGDYIQSLAASQFFTQKDFVYVSRERLHEYKGDDIRLIMNGWFMQNPGNWPPGAKIHPLFVSFHLNSLARKEMMTEKSISYFKQYAPIGCRDYDTVSLLKSRGIDAYFSGCLTLTLGKTFKNTLAERSNIYFVDAHHVPTRNLLTLLQMILLAFRKFRIISALSKKNRGNTSLKNLLSYSFFYATYSKMFNDDVLMNAEYIRHEIQDSFHTVAEKFEYAQNLLKKYAGAKYIITSRIHCALPCLGMDTPVLYVEDTHQPEASYCRLNGLRELFHVINYSKGNLASDFIKEKITKDSVFKNKEDYKVLYKKLSLLCEEFIKSEPTTA